MQFDYEINQSTKPMEAHTARRDEAWAGVESSNYPNLRKPKNRDVRNIAEAQVKPYIDALVQYDNNPYTDRLGMAVYDGEFEGDAEATVRTEFKARTIEQTDRGSRAIEIGAKILQLANANPEDVTPGRVLDEERAEVMARAMAPHQNAEKAARNARKPFYRTQKRAQQLAEANSAAHLKQSEQAGQEASAAYYQSMINDARKF